MCGIAAVYSRSGLIDGSVLEDMNMSQLHRGPDAQKTWLSNSREVGLGHTRLSIVDLDSGDQPMSNEDDSIHMVVNGELYGYKSLRNELELQGHVFCSLSDSEIAIHLYEEYGEQFVEKLRGEFALLLWDERKNCLFAARDRFGIKPLFYSERDGSIYFSSEVKALFRVGITPSWSRNSFINYLYFSVLPEETWFENVHQVPPGHLMVINRKHTKIKKYWDIDYPLANELAGAVDEDKFISGMEEVFEEAVSVRTVADVSIGFHLSGGIDSSSIVAKASRWDRDLMSFTIRFPNTKYNEADCVAKTIQKLGIRNHFINYEDIHYFKYLEKAGYYGESIQENAHGIARFLLSKKIHDIGYKAVLAGEGGDELFGGYQHFQRDLKYSTDPYERWKRNKTYQRLLEMSKVETALQSLVKSLGFIPEWILQRYFSITQWITPMLSSDFTWQFRNSNVFSELLHSSSVQEQLNGRSPFHQSAYLFNKTRLPNYILYAERLDMANSVEVRLPYLDHYLFDYVKQMPLFLYNKNGIEKYPLRKITRKDLSHIGEKKPFLAPPKIRTQEYYRTNFLREVVESDGMKKQPFFDQGKLRRALNKFESSFPKDAESFETIWQIVIGVWVLTCEFNIS